MALVPNASVRFWMQMVKEVEIFDIFRLKPSKLELCIENSPYLAFASKLFWLHLKVTPSIGIENNHRKKCKQSLIVSFHARLIIFQEYTFCKASCRQPQVQKARIIARKSLGWNPWRKSESQKMYSALSRWFLQLYWWTRGLSYVKCLCSSNWEEKFASHGLDPWRRFQCWRQWRLFQWSRISSG